VVVTLLAITLSISVLVKIFAWQVLLARDGPINALLLGAGIASEPLLMLYTRPSVVVAMVQIMAPYACLLLIAGMRRIDRDLLTAARTLGAGPLVVFRDVYWPQVRFGVVMTTLIIFIGSSGFFVAPALVGGPSEIMLGMKMQSDLVNQYETGLAATTGILLTLFLLALTFVALRLSGRSFRHLAEELGR
jgi:putative spermidine/putrescine transport system permease protein